MKNLDQIEIALLEALPFVEDAQKNPVYKSASVEKTIKKIRKALSLIDTMRAPKKATSKPNPDEFRGHESREIYKCDMDIFYARTYKTMGGASLVIPQAERFRIARENMRAITSFYRHFKP